MLKGIVSYADSVGLQVRKLDYSPITGPKGNIEFLAEIRPKEADAESCSSEQVRRTVAAAHAEMGRDKTEENE